MTAKDITGGKAVPRIDGAAERFDRLVSCISGVAFVRTLSPAGVIAYPWFSDGVEAVLGFPSAAMAVNAKGCLHVVHWADRDRHLDQIRRSAESLAPCVEEFRAVTAQGDVRWLRGRSRPWRGGDGVIVWDGVLIDVTAEWRADFRLQMLMDHAEDSILILDGQGRIESANAAARRLFGTVDGDLAGLSLHDLVVSTSGTGNPLDPDTPAGIVGGGPRELAGRRRDGTIFPLELTTNEVRLDGQRLFLGIGRDITRRRRTEAALQESETRLRAITANMPGMVFQRAMRPDGRIDLTYVSEGCRTVLGVGPEILTADHDHFLALLTPEERETFQAGLARSAEAMTPFDEEVSVPGPDRRRRWLRGRSRPTLQPDGGVVWDGVMLDITERRLAEQRLSFLAYHDPLTRLPNRVAFLDRFAEASRDAQRQSALMAVVSLGLDRLGAINATMGHAIGDQVLLSVADLIRAAIGSSDMMARVSGDHFLLLLTGHDNRHDLDEALDRLYASAQTVVTVASQDFDVSAAMGVALFPRDGEDAETLIKNADAALQRAKNQDVAAFQMFTKDLSTRAAKTLTVQNRLRRAIDQGELEAHYQPQVDLSTGCLTGMEALVRWTSPDLGPIPPSEFIPVAEESGLIDAVCEFMLDACTRQVRAWQEDGLALVPVAVNVSGRQFQYARRLIGVCERVLASTGLDSRWLELELTETSAMRDADNAIAVVQRLKDMGIGCAIDDFGTGYSSLSVLKRFPIQKLKIDRSFVMDVTTDSNDAAIVAAIIGMAKAMKLKVVAEGVERQEHLDFLRTLGCDQIQGYLISRPLPAVGMRALLPARGLSGHAAPWGGAVAPPA